MHAVDFLRHACKYASLHSDDPRTKNGAVLVAGTGEWIAAANSLPVGVTRDPERLEPPAKYRFIEHAERGVIFRAAKLGMLTEGSRIYCPWFACTDCARAIICAGVQQIVGVAKLRNETPERWESEILLAEQMLREAGVGMLWITDAIGETVQFDGRLVEV